MIWPELMLRLKPVGKLPLTTDHSPPLGLAVRVKLYGVRMVPWGSADVMILTIIGAGPVPTLVAGGAGGLTTVIVNERLAGVVIPSDTTAVKLKVPVAVGEPVIRPFAAMLMLVGRPEATVVARVAAPPVLAMNA